MIVAGKSTFGNAIKILDSHSLKMIETWHTGYQVAALIVSPNERYLAVGGQQPNIIQVFDIKSGGVVTSIDMEFQIFSIAFLSSGVLAVGCGSCGKGGILLYDILKGEKVGAFPSAEGWPLCLAEAGHGAFLLSGNPCRNGGTILLHSLDSEKPIPTSLRSLPIHNGMEGTQGICSLTLDGDYVVSVGGSDFAAHIVSLKALPRCGKDSSAEANEGLSVPSSSKPIEIEMVDSNRDMFGPTTDVSNPSNPLHASHAANTSEDVADGTEGRMRKTHMRTTRVAPVVSFDCGAPALCVAVVGGHTRAFAVGCGDGKVRIFGY